MEREDKSPEQDQDLATAEVAEALEQQKDQEMVDALRSLGASGSGARIFWKVASQDASERSTL